MKAFPYLISIILNLLIFANSENSAQKLTAENTLRGITLNTDWKISFDKIENWNANNFDDSEWIEGNTNSTLDSLFREVRNEKLWLRKTIYIDSTLVNKPLLLNLYLAGEVQIFISGKEFGKFGVLENDSYRSKKSLTFTNDEYYSIAIEYVNNNYKNDILAGFSSGFYLNLIDPENYIDFRGEQLIFDISYQLIFTAFTFAFALLHFIMFIHLPSLRSNIFFSIFLIFFALNIYFDYQSLFSSYIDDNILYLRFQRATLPFVHIFNLRFIYALFDIKVPRYYWAIIVFLIAGGILAVISPIHNLGYFNIIALLVVLEQIRVLFSAIKNKVDDAIIIAVGFILLFAFSSYDLLLDNNLLDPIARLTNGYIFGAACLIICVSIFLAKAFARSNKKMVEEESKRLIIEADNERKTHELDEARKLQLSLLPEVPTELNGFEVCFDMKTATEVGGDYYDYMITEDGTLTIVIGDATGHGMKAGNMVVLIKSLFNTMGHTFYIPDFFNHCTKQIKRMKFGNLFMSMTMIKVIHNKIVYSSAGMPPSLIYRSKSTEVEEIKVKGMPLGAHNQFPYEQQNISLDSGDVLLLMTDGLMEQFNDKKEMFEVERIRKVLLDNSGKSTVEIKNKLFEASDDWANGESQTDDITFVVMKCK